MLAAVPELGPTLRTAAPEELADIFDAFNVKVVYDKANRKLALAATLTDELVWPENEKSPTATGPVGEFVHSGGGIRTRDLRVMSPASYQTAPPRGVDEAV
jgi:hypothetical protein